MSTPRVTLAADGLDLTPREFADLLSQLTSGQTVRSDEYGRGGAVEAFEGRFATFVGKERAIMMPTGTLANLTALERLAGPHRRRVIVQRDSHVFNDTGDGAARLAGLTLVPLQDWGVGFSLAAVRAEVDRATSGKVRGGVGAVSIETPLRRGLGRRFDEDELESIGAYVRSQGIGFHLDGARLMALAAYSGRAVRDWAGLFDMVYVSLWKQLHTPFGAMLAGAEDRIDPLHHERRRYGGALHQMWPAAAVANHFLDEIEATWQRLIPHAETVFRAVSEAGRFRVIRIPDGTSVARLTPVAEPPALWPQIRAAATGNNVHLPAPDAEGFTVKVNPTWLRVEPDDLATALNEAAEAVTARR